MNITEFTNLRKVEKIAGLILADAACVFLSYFCSLLLRFGGWIPAETLELFYQSVGPIILLHLALFALFTLYNSLWTTAGISELMRLASATAIASAFAYGVMFFITRDSLPVSAYLAGGLLIILSTGFVRMSYRLLRRMISIRANGEPKRVLVIGAGETGDLVVRHLQEKRTLGMKPVVIVDDNRSLRGHMLRGVRIAGGRSEIGKIVEKNRIEVIVFAAPSATAADRREILSLCSETQCTVKTVPGMKEILSDNAVSEIRNLEMADLLARPEIRICQSAIKSAIEGTVVLVTGGAGSIGSELCRQIALFAPRKIVIFDVYENSSYALQLEFQRRFPEIQFFLEIGSVRDEKRLDEVFAKYRPSYVFHAAAHKHVPLMENSPREAVKNNVFGTLYTAQAAEKYGVKRFVLISTDKAVHPSSVMGASKRLAEHVIQYMNSFSRTRFVAVRFGNVLGSNGSVIPIFQKQIEEGGPVTVTHKDMTRFFMTIPEAARLVIQAGVNGNSGEIYILDMGEPVRIDDIARTLIRLAGHRPEVDIPIEYTGLRPGEKLYEELFLDEEQAVKSDMEGILIGTATSPTPAQFEMTLAYLKEQMYSDSDMKECLRRVLKTYRPEKFSVSDCDLLEEDACSGDAEAGEDAETVKDLLSATENEKALEAKLRKRGFEIGPRDA